MRNVANAAILSLACALTLAPHTASAQTTTAESPPPASPPSASSTKRPITYRGLEMGVDVTAGRKGEVAFICRSVEHARIAGRAIQQDGCRRVRALFGGRHVPSTCSAAIAPESRRWPARRSRACSRAPTTRTASRPTRPPTASANSQAACACRSSRATTSWDRSRCWRLHRGSSDWRLLPTSLRKA